MDALTQLQIDWENKYNNLKEYGLLAEDFLSLTGTMFDDDKEAKIASRIMTQVYLHKRIPVSSLIPMMATKESMQTIAEILEKTIEKNLVKYNSDREEVIVLYQPEQEIIETLDQYQFPPPILCTPKPIINNNDSAYLTIKHDSIILNRDLNDRNNDYCLEVINYLNNIKFIINKPVNDAIHNSWNGVKEPKADESKEDFDKKVKAFNKYNENANVLIDMIEDKEFYLSHHYDKRGRIYSQGYYINYQGNDWNKGCVLFANEEYLDEE